MNTYDFVMLSCFALYGFSKACCDVKTDLGRRTKIRKLFTWISGRLADWYEGGNANYNPSFFGDFWHFFDKLRGYSMLAAVLVAPLSTWYVAVAGFVLSLFVFVVCYHTVFPIDGEPTLESILRVAWPFKNYHRGER